MQNEWINVKDRLPDESGEYLTFDKSGHFGLLEYSTLHKKFNVFDCQSIEFVERYSIEITHWMPLPEPPKEGADNG